MKQMVQPDVPVCGRERFNKVEYGFMRDAEGRIFFLRAYGSETIRQVVFEDGTIATQGDFLHPSILVDLVRPQDLGITEIKQAPRDARLD